MNLSSSESPEPANPAPPKPSVLFLSGTTLLVVLNMFLAFAKGMRDSGNVSRALGAATAQFVIPVIVAALFSLSPRFRNPRSRTRIVFWTSVVVLLSTLGNLSRH